MYTNITEAFTETIDFHYVKSIIRSNKKLKSLWGGKTPSRADLKRVILNMIDRVSQYEDAEDCVNGIIVRKYSDMIRIDFLYLSYSLRMGEPSRDTQEETQQEIEPEKGPSLILP